MVREMVLLLRCWAMLGPKARTSRPWRAAPKAKVSASPRLRRTLLVSRASTDLCFASTYQPHPFRPRSDAESAFLFFRTAHRRERRRRRGRVPSFRSLRLRSSATSHSILLPQVSPRVLFYTSPPAHHLLTSYRVPRLPSRDPTAIVDTTGYDPHNPLPPPPLSRYKGQPDDAVGFGPPPGFSFRGNCLVRDEVLGGSSSVDVENRSQWASKGVSGGGELFAGGDAFVGSMGGGKTEGEACSPLASGSESRGECVSGICMELREIPSV